MRKKLTAIFSILLITLSATNMLFAKSQNSCKTAAQDNDHSCCKNMEKMDFCAVEQKEKSCTCPEMNRNSQSPAEQEPAPVLLNLNENLVKYLGQSYDIFNINIEHTREFISFNFTNLPNCNNKIYKTLHSFLI